MRIILFITLSLISPCVFSQVKKISAETTIQQVTIFSSGARVERSSSISLLPGRTEISFTGLSNQLDQQSVQLKANANITLLSVQAAKDFLSERKITDDEKAFINNINSLNEKLTLDNKMLEVYKNEETMLIKNEAIGGQNGVKTTELKEALDLHRQRLTEVYQKQLEIQKRIEEEQQQITRLNAQLLEISKKKDSVNYIVTALIDSKEAANVKFQLSYNVKDAGWYPAYDVRVKEVSAPLNVLMNANIFQRSGETWKNISLQLSTGSPNDNATPQQLLPWKLGFYDPSVSFRNQPQQGAASGRVTNENGEPINSASVIILGTHSGVATDDNGFFKLTHFPANSSVQVSAVGYESKTISLLSGYYTISLKTAANALSEVVVTGYGLQGKVSGVSINDKSVLKEEKKSIQTVMVSTEYQPTTTVYKIEDKYTIETDGKTTTIGIKNFEVPASYEYFTAPKTDASSFLTAKIINWQDYDLQSGEANLYFEGTYLGKTYIDLGATEDTLSLSLGKDNGVKVSLKLIKEFSSRRFIGSNKTESRQYQISLRNTRKETIHIIVQDQFPVSTTKEISVNDMKAPGAVVDEDTGIATWDISLAPGEEKKVLLSYTVKYPRDRKVILE